MPKMTLSRDVWQEYQQMADGRSEPDYARYPTLEIMHEIAHIGAEAAMVNWREFVACWRNLARRDEYAQALTRDYALADATDADIARRVFNLAVAD